MIGGGAIASEPSTEKDKPKIARAIENFRAESEGVTSDALYTNAYLSSLWIAAVSTIVTLMIAYPVAYGMAKAPSSIRPTR